MKITKPIKKWLRQLMNPGMAFTDMEVEQELIVRGPDGKIKKKIKTRG